MDWSMLGAVVPAATEAGLFHSTLPALSLESDILMDLSVNPLQKTRNLSVF